MERVEIVGAGYYVPDRVVTNAEICRMIPGWPPDKLGLKTGILERRFLWAMDEKSGYPIEPTGPGKVIKSGVDMSEIALQKALDMAGIEAAELDALLLVTCTPDEINFESDAMHLADRMGVRPDARIIQIDSGCGGALYLLSEAKEKVESGRYKYVALIAHNLTSALVDRDMYERFVQRDGRKLGAFLSPYIFGDGAGVLVLGPCSDPDRGFVNSWERQRLIEYMYREGGGGLKPPDSPRTSRVDHAFIIDGGLVYKEFPVYMGNCVNGVLEGYEHLFPQIHRFFLHQANMRLVELFAKKANLPMDRVPMHMDRYGNTSAAGTLILFAEDLQDGNVALGSGQLVLFATIGAGAHYAAHLIRL
ncbi:MAG: ketoacyl-ACP synthase III [Patescibacteria group bacterium]|nr:ketoacyl-ACP synthase III [Patescibacteria group bacterium]